jgi:hypothetical protein
MTGGAISAPYGAHRNLFSLKALRREIAAYYGISAERMARPGGGAEYQEAREALAWKMTAECRITQGRAAQLLGVEQQTISRWVRSHIDRIQEYRHALKLDAIEQEAVMSEALSQ